ARVVGDVLGKFHPHGDQSAYDALVRLSQDFSLRYPLIDGHGNFGSRDGDGAAAMRYTEARLTNFSEILLSEVDEGTVNFKLNYDGSFFEPDRFPARLPVCILNGASGIAVGMATEIPPHNLCDVAQAVIELLNNPKVTDEHLINLINGPDYPGGGQIISSKAHIRDLYLTGKGTLRTQARWKFEDLARGQWQLVVYELPPGVSSKKILEEIEDLTNPKLKNGKKTLTSLQTQSKQLVLGKLASVRDESGKDYAVRLVFEPKSSRVNRKDFTSFLLSQTSLQSTVSINLVAINEIGKPKLFSFGELIRNWTKFRVSTTKKRTKHRLQKITERLHILNGRLKALESIDLVISIIRESEDPKLLLIEKLDISNEQADDILDIRLKQLARMEFIKIKTEFKEKNKISKDLNRILKNERFLKQLVVREVGLDTEKFGDKRRTLIKEDEVASVTKEPSNEPVTVIISENGWVRIRQGHGHENMSFNFKTGDNLHSTYECSTLDHVVSISTAGRSYTVAIRILPGGRTDGIPFTSLIDLEPGESLITYAAGSMKDFFLLTTKKGLGFITKLESLLSRNRSGKHFLNLDVNDSPISMNFVEGGNNAIAILSKLQRLIIFGQNEIKQLLSGGRGVCLITLTSEDELISIDMVGLKGLVLQGFTKNQKLKQQKLSRNDLFEYISKRGRKGKFLRCKFNITKIKALN
ncbi:MAG: DNA topoisomerase IV subunit A, partial [Betaproteobacteria bacterium TMED156]